MPTKLDYNSAHQSNKQSPTPIGRDAMASSSSHTARETRLARSQTSSLLPATLSRKRRETLIELRQSRELRLLKSPPVRRSLKRRKIRERRILRPLTQLKERMMTWASRLWKTRPPSSREIKTRTKNGRTTKSKILLTQLSLKPSKTLRPSQRRIKPSKTITSRIWLSSFVAT